MTGEILFICAVMGVPAMITDLIAWLRKRGVR
jgi:hypothetical protein